jgi:hypothetical protein
MFSASTYVIRVATAADEPALRRLSEVDAQDPLTAGPILVGEVDGKSEAAFSLADGRTLANPLVPTAHLLAQLRMRAGALGAYEHSPSLPTRLRAALSGAVLSRPLTAPA